MINVQKSVASKLPAGKERSYQEVVTFLDQHWQEERSNLDLMKKLDKELGSPSKSVKTIFVGGNNGKSLTIHFASRLLKEEGLSVGAFSTPHMLTYNERIAVNQESISNNEFAELANHVINTALTANITPHTQEILTLMALICFKNKGVDVALLETSSKKRFWDPINVCKPVILGITRITEQHPETTSLQETIEKTLSTAHKDSWVVSADQSKLNLEAMLTFITNHGGQWAMPIRKLTPLVYPYEQLHGRCAALAERIGHLFVNNVIAADSTVVQDSLLVKQKGQRGRPTLEVKRQIELHPRRTLEEFWQEVATELPSRFHFLEKEKPAVLLDNASNIDGLQNLLLGIRLLHYQRNLKGLTIIIGSHEPYLGTIEFAKMIRYFFKKTSGNLILTQVDPEVGMTAPETSIDLTKVATDLKAMKVKVKVAQSFSQAFEMGTKLVDKQHGLLAITGSDSIISQYWAHKGIKKF